jgi:hypothetical protein|tara:strand:- start:812 stop:1078 length:267 start_codon:yes stop_codon:yes gene_type:complete
MSEEANMNELGEISAPMPESAAPEETAGTSLELTVNDLQLLRQVIEVATSRGAFKANEMLSVGTVFNKLETFLTAVEQQQKQGDANGS